MLALAAAAALPLAAIPFAARAYPDGAPWKTLDRPGEACASCHFGSASVAGSEALSLAGAPVAAEPGETYELTLRFAPGTPGIAGYLAAFHRADGEAGAVAAEGEQEAKGAAVRSTVPLPVSAETQAEWRFAWTAPATPGPVALHIAANAANDDASPFGDMVHVKTLMLAVE